MSDANTPATEGSKTPEGQEPQSVEALPEWAREKLSKANAEAAKYRTEKNAAVEAAKAEVTSAFEAKLAEAAQKTQAVEAEVAAKAVLVDKLKVAFSSVVSSDPEKSAAVMAKAEAFANLLQGSNEAEFKSHAETLRTLFKVADESGKASDPSQGQGNVDPLNGDPLLAKIVNIVGQ